MLGKASSVEQTAATVCRKFCKPAIRATDQTKLVEFYVALRNIAGQAGGMPITVRHLESIIRMATANAKIRLSPVVDKRDLDLAISTMLESFMQTQKQSVVCALGNRFSKYRALASSPDEVLSNIIMDMDQRRITAKRGDMKLSEFKIVRSRSMGLSHTRALQLAKVLYSLPEPVVQAFIRSDAFTERFNLEPCNADHVIKPKSRIRAEC